VKCNIFFWGMAIIFAWGVFSVLRGWGLGNGIFYTVWVYSLELGELWDRASLSVSVAGGLQSPVRGMGDRGGAKAAEIKILDRHTAV